MKRLSEDYELEVLNVLSSQSSCRCCLFLKVQMDCVFILPLIAHACCKINETRDFWSVLWRKIKFQHETSFIFIFYCGTVLRETGEKNGGFIYDFIWHQK